MPCLLPITGYTFLILDFIILELESTILSIYFHMKVCFQRHQAMFQQIGYYAKQSALGTLDG